MRIFTGYSRHYLRRRFHSIRILRSGLPPRAAERPLVIYLNHASWWDPLVCLLLAQEWFADCTSFGPIDAAMLSRYGFFKHLGFYGVEQHSILGARQFLRTTRAILAKPNSAVWLTPQGRFADVRERPLRSQPGLGALATQSKNAIFLPLAIEYAFWSEPRPEILLSFGQQIVPPEKSRRTVEEWTSVFNAALEETQEELAGHSCRRDPADWLVLNRGASSVNPIYDAWRWLRAHISRETFVREHHVEVSR